MQQIGRSGEKVRTYFFVIYAGDALADVIKALVWSIEIVAV